MEDLENKINSDDPIVVANIISKLLEVIKTKTDEKDVPQLKFLKEKCMVSDPDISNVACKAIVTLVQDSVLNIDTTLADFITMIPYTKCFSSLTTLLGNILFLELKNKILQDTSYKSPYNLCLPQHPFVNLLNENPSNWNNIFTEMKLFYKCKNKRLASHANDLFKPVYLFTICNPEDNNKLEFFKQKLWSLQLDCDVIQNYNVINDILCWMQFNTKNSVLYSEFVDQLINLNSEKKIVDTEILLLWQVSILYNMILNKNDPRATINSIGIVIRNLKKLVSQNIVLLLLAKTIRICPVNYLYDLFNICQLIVMNQKLNIYVSKTVQMSLLTWISASCVLSNEALNIAKEIYVYINSLNTNYNDECLNNFVRDNRILITSNHELYTAIELCEISQKWKDFDDILNWLKTLEDAPHSFIKEILQFLYALVLLDGNSLVTQKSFNLLMNFAEKNKQVMPDILTIILYKLSNTTNKDTHFMLLKALPKMIMVKDNLQKVMVSIQALSKGPGVLQQFSVSLMYDAWNIDNKCYHYLEKMLMEAKRSDMDLWEFNVTRAYILKKLCEKRPELYGKEIVAHLSKILNECNDENGTLSCALAIEGITSLCKAEIIDVVTTWATLAPKFKDDTRILVIKSICNLFSEIPHLSYTESYPELIKDVVSQLWSYVMNFKQIPEITESALNALSSFGLEHISAQMPEVYLEEEVAQKDASGGPWGLTIPGKCWIKFLRDSNKAVMKEVGDFLIKLVSAEISAYMFHIYQVKGSKEPLNFGYLPSHSVVRAIGEYIKLTILKHSDIDVVYLECLRIFGQEYSKPLPPFDWCFLQQIVHLPETKYYCIDIACHQVMLSGSARRFVENYIVAITSENNDVNDVLNMYKNLKHLANSIQPMILKPFIEATVRQAIDYYNSNIDTDYLNNVIKNLNEVLENDTIQDTNKAAISQVISDFVFSTDISSDLFSTLLKCVQSFPVKCINEITINLKDANEEWHKKMVLIRSARAMVAVNEPLDWLNNLLDINYASQELLPTIWTQFIPVFKKHINNTQSSLWLFELIGKIQQCVADRCEEKLMTYLFNVFMLAVVTFSGYFSFFEQYQTNSDVERLHELFPQATASLLDVNHWSICTIQALEWLYHMTTETSVPAKYRHVFAQTLQCLRHEDEFVKNLKWMKYLNCPVTYS